MSIIASLVSSCILSSVASNAASTDNGSAVVANRATAQMGVVAAGFFRALGLI